MFIPVSVKGLSGSNLVRASYALLVSPHDVYQWMSHCSFRAKSLRSCFRNLFCVLITFPDFFLPAGPWQLFFAPFRSLPFPPNSLTEVHQLSARAFLLSHCFSNCPSFIHLFFFFCMSNIVPPRAHPCNHPITIRWNAPNPISLQPPLSFSFL